MINATTERIAPFAGIVITQIIAVLSLAAEPTRDIQNGRRQLFLDDWLIAATTDVSCKEDKASKDPGNPLIWRDKPWDQGRADLYGAAP